MNTVNQTPMTHLDAALRYAVRGWRVFPLQPREKKPLPGSHGLNDATTDEATIRAWWGKHPEANIGLATGHGWFVVDIDGLEGEAALADLERLHGALPATVEQRTGRGRHLLFRDDVPFGDAIRNSAGQIGPKIDVRGLGGYIVAPPSIHPDGRIYQWASGAGPKNREIAEAPPWLVRAAEKPTQEAQKAAPDSRKAERVDFDGAAAQSASGDSYGAAALAGECEAIRAAPNGRQQETLNSAALKIGSLVAGESLDRDAARVALITAGMAMTSYDARRPWTHSEVSRAVDRGLRDGAHNPRGPSENATRGEFRPAGETINPTPEAWEAPDLSLLGTGRRTPPEFPIDLLGAYWGDWVKRRAAGASAPVDYVAAGLLASAGAVLANARQPLAGAEWSEPPLLWCALVGSPSAGKSPALSEALSLVKYAEAQMANGFDDVRRDYETKRQFAKAKHDAWLVEMKEAAKAGGRAPPIPDEAIAPDEPQRPRIMVSDSTVEKLAMLAAALPRGLLLVRDELAGWFMSFDRYGSGDREFAIETYGGRTYTVDRVKHPVPIRIPRLSVGLVGGVQPDKIAAIITGPDDGLSSRLLWFWPEALPDFNLARDRADETGAKDALARLASLPLASDDEGNPCPRIVRLTPEAANEIEEFEREIRRRSQAAGGLLAGAIGKARGHVLRLSTVLEFLWWAAAPGSLEPGTISAHAVVSAAALMDSYFLPMTERVLGDAAIPATERAAMELLRYLRANGLAEFNARTVRREIGGTLREAPAMDGACAVLIEAGWVRQKSSEGQGRKPKAFIVNPKLYRGGE